MITFVTCLLGIVIVTLCNWFAWSDTTFWVLFSVLVLWNGLMSVNERIGLLRQLYYQYDYSKPHRQVTEEEQQLWKRQAARWQLTATFWQAGFGSLFALGCAWLRWGYAFNLWLLCVAVLACTLPTLLATRSLGKLYLEACSFAAERMRKAD